MAAAKIEMEQAAMQVRQIELQIATDVTNAAISIRNDIQAAQSAPADRGNQPLFLVEPQRRCRNPGSLRHLRDVQVSHPLDLKST